MKIFLRSKNKFFHFEAENETGSKVQMDADVKIGGANLGARPMELLLMGLGGCSAIDIVSILKKQKQKINNFNIEIEGEKEKREGEETSLFSKIIMHFFLEGEIELSKAERAAKLSVEKYCSVGKTLELAGAKIDYKISVNEKKI